MDALQQPITSKKALLKLLLECLAIELALQRESLQISSPEAVHALTNEVTQLFVDSAFTKTIDIGEEKYKDLRALWDSVQPTAAELEQELEACDTHFHACDIHDGEQDEEGTAQEASTH